jgi:hypothetical protein
MQRENFPVHSSQLKSVRGACPMREMQRLSMLRHDTQAVCRAAQNGIEYPLTPRSTARVHDVFADDRQMRANFDDVTPHRYGATCETRVMRPLL